MTLRWLLAAGHLLALGIGLGAVWARNRALAGRLDVERVRRALAADSWWGAAGALWIGTGLWRLFGGTEKAPAYYFANHVFWTKMGLLGVLLVLEVVAVVTLAGWRRRFGRGELPDAGSAVRIARISAVQVVLVLLMMLAATAMARGIGAR